MMIKSLVSVNLSLGATLGGMAASISTSIPERLDNVLTTATL